MNEIIIERVDTFVDAFVDTFVEEDKVEDKVEADNTEAGSTVVADMD